MDVRAVERDRAGCAAGVAGAAGEGRGRGHARRRRRRDRRADRDDHQEQGGLTMSGVLVIAEARRGELRDVSLELLERGVHAGRPGQRPARRRRARPDALNVAGVETILHRARREHYEPHVAEAAAARRRSSASHPTFVLAAHSVDAMGYAPAVAAELGLGFASDVMLGLPGDARRLRRPAGGDARVRRPGAADGPRGRLRSAPRAAAPPRSRRSRSTSRWRAVEHLGYVEAETGDVDITAAGFVLSIGRGVEDADERRRVRGDRRAAQRDAGRLAAAGRRRARERGAPGRAVGQDGQAEGLPRARDLGRDPAPGRHAQGGHDHRRQHRPGGADLPGRPLRRGRRPLRRGTGAAPALRVTREVFWHFPGWLEALWYVLAVASVGVFAYGLWRPLRHYRRGRATAAALRRGAEDRARASRTVRRRDTPAPASRTPAMFYGFVTLFIGTVVLRSTPMSPSASSAGASSRATSTAGTR